MSHGRHIKPQTPAAIAGTIALGMLCVLGAGFYLLLVGPGTPGGPPKPGSGQDRGGVAAPAPRSDRLGGDHSSPGPHPQPGSPGMTAPPGIPALPAPSDRTGSSVGAEPNATPTPTAPAPTRTAQPQTPVAAASAPAESAQPQRTTRTPQRTSPDTSSRSSSGQHPAHRPHRAHHAHPSAPGREHRSHHRDRGRHL
ncbi:MAG: hypothetical protein ACXVXG_13095, partial [Nocardioidaceae bacterium]